MYTGIRVKNLDDSIKFFVEVMGMEVKERYPIESNNSEVAVLWSKEGGAELELNYYKEESRFYEPYSSGQELDHLAFWLGEDYDRFLAEARRKGYPPVLEVKSSISRYSFIKDPNGIFILIA